MKFRTLSRLIYLIRSGHRRGHGIHSPFLFRLITTVIEERETLPEYIKFKELVINALQLLNSTSDHQYEKVYQQFNLKVFNPDELYKKVELPLRYSKILFRLARFFKPSSVINWGPAFGVNLGVLAMADRFANVYQVINDHEFVFFCRELLKDPVFSNIRFLTEYQEIQGVTEFVIINWPYDTEKSRQIVQKCINRHGDNDVLIIRGIHESKEMESMWLETLSDKCLFVSLDLFEIGIVFFHKGLQKENFIIRF